MQKIKNNCLICMTIQKSIGGLSSHIRCNHQQVSIKEYYDKYLKTLENNGICKLNNCENITTFVSLSKGYLRYCCNSHAQKDTKIQNKIKETRKNRYGNENFTNSE